MKQQDIDRSVFLGDTHFPYEDARAVRVALELIEHLKPSQVFLLGDIQDFYQLSKFDKDPNRVVKMQDDLDRTFAFMSSLRLRVGDAEITYVCGNHEERLMKYLWRHPEIANLRSLQPEELLRLKELNIRWVPQNKTFAFHGFVVTHGSIIRRYSGYTARGEMDKYGTSGISGHTHRVGVCLHTNFSGAYAWYEAGCLCKLTPEYVVGPPNWQHGISVGEFIKGDNRFQISQYNIIKGKLLYQGELFD